MTDFRGVEKVALIDSIGRAMNYLRGLELGGNTDAAIDILQEEDIPGKIARAENNEQLADVMRTTGALPYLSQFGDVIAFHAAAEAADGKGHEVQDLYRDLSAWSAFFDETVKPDPDLRKEIQSHIVYSTLDRLTAADAAGQDCDARLHATVADVAKTSKPLAEWLEQNVPVYRLLYAGEPSPEVAELIEASNSVQGAALQKTLYEMSGLPPKGEVLAAPQAMDQYSITLENQAGAMPEARWMPHVQAARKKMLMAILPFAKTAQTAHIEVRPLMAEKDKWTFSFYGTKRAAQAVAVALKTLSYNVIDAKGQAVEAILPPSSGSAPAPGVS